MSTFWELDDPCEENVKQAWCFTVRTEIKFGWEFLMWVLTGGTYCNLITNFQRWIMGSSGETRSPYYALIFCTACRERVDCSQCLPNVEEHPRHQGLFCPETVAALSCLLYTSLTRSMMQFNKQAKVMSNGDVMGRGPTNEVSRQSALSHTKIHLRQTAGGHACGTRYLIRLCRKYLMRFARRTYYGQGNHWADCWEGRYFSRVVEWIWFWFVSIEYLMLSKVNDIEARQIDRLAFGFGASQPRCT